MTGGIPGATNDDDEGELRPKSVSKTTIAAGVTIALLVVICCMLGAAKRRHDQSLTVVELKLAERNNASAEVEYNSAVTAALKTATDGNEPTYAVPNKAKKRRHQNKILGGRLSPIPEYSMASAGGGCLGKEVAYDRPLQHTESPETPEYAMAAGGDVAATVSYDHAAQGAPDPEYALATSGSSSYLQTPPASPAPVAAYAMASAFATPGRYDTGMGDDMYFAGTQLFSPAKSPQSMYEEASYNMATDVATMPVYDMAGNASKRSVRFLSPQKAEDDRSMTALRRASSSSSPVVYHTASSGPVYQFAAGTGSGAAVQPATVSAAGHRTRSRGGITQHFAKRQSVVLQNRFSRIESQRGGRGANGGKTTKKNPNNIGTEIEMADGDAGSDDEGGIFNMLRTLTMTKKRFSKHGAQVKKLKGGAIAASVVEQAVPDYLQPVLQADPNRETPEYALASSAAAASAVDANCNINNTNADDKNTDPVYPMACKADDKPLSYADGMVTPTRATTTTAYEEFDRDVSILEASSLGVFDALVDKRTRIREQLRSSYVPETPKYAIIEDAVDVDVIVDASIGGVSIVGVDDSSSNHAASLTPASAHNVAVAAYGSISGSPVYCEVGTPFEKQRGEIEEPSPVYHEIGTPMVFPRDRKTVRFAAGSPMHAEQSPMYHEIGTPIAFPRSVEKRVTLRVPGKHAPPVLQLLSPREQAMAARTTVIATPSNTAFSSPADVLLSTEGGYSSTSKFRTKASAVEAQYMTLRSIIATPNSGAAAKLDVAELRDELKSSAFGNIEGMEMEELMELVLALEEGGGADGSSSAVHRRAAVVADAGGYNVNTNIGDHQARTQHKSGPILLSPKVGNAMGNRTETSRYIDVFAPEMILIPNDGRKKEKKEKEKEKGKGAEKKQQKKKKKAKAVTKKKKKEKQQQVFETNPTPPKAPHTFFGSLLPGRLVSTRSLSPTLQSFGPPPSDVAANVGADSPYGNEGGAGGSDGNAAYRMMGRSTSFTTHI